MIALPALHLGAPVQAGPLTVFPVWTDVPLDDRPYRTTLPKAGKVAELQDGPSVPELKVTNPGAAPVLLIEGALLEGGWQHRVLAHSVLVGAHDDVTVEVRCVEQRRWGGDRDQRLGSRSAPLAVRGALRGIRTGVPRQAEHAHFADQSDVWERVTHYERSYGRSDTSSLVEVQTNLDNQVQGVVKAVRPLPAQRGVLIGIGGHPVLLEMFDHPQTLIDEWDAILSSVAVDGLLTPAEATPGHRARAFVRGVMATDVVETGPAGTATAFAGSDGNLVSARGIATADRIIHAAVINIRHEVVLAA
jgi:ARG and Rhodanese-Phosphatase-superfamily-associated Protein domain